jgi:predicted membrane channel-forming protein YqfA (hemolysin III family)
LQDWGTKLRKEWAAMSQVAAWFLTLIGGFLLPPAIGLTKEDSDAWRRFGAFILTVTVGLLFLASRRWKTKPFGVKWTVASVIFLLLAATSFVEYQWLSDERTCLYQGQKVVIGTQYTIQGLHHVQANPGISCVTLFEDFTGKADDIWTTNSINHSRILLGTTYIVALPLFAMCVVALVQAISISKTA